MYSVTQSRRCVSAYHVRSATGRLHVKTVFTFRVLGRSPFPLRGLSIVGNCTMFKGVFYRSSKMIILYASVLSSAVKY